MTVGLMLFTIKLRQQAKQNHQSDHRQPSPAVRRRADQGTLAHLLRHGPVNTFWITVRITAAVTSRPRIETVAATQDSGNTPRKIRNSPDKSVEPRKPERREKRNAHQPGKHRSRLAQSAEVVDPALPAAALLNHGDKPEERRRRDAVIEHLQDHAVERCGLAGLAHRARRWHSQRENAQQAIAEVIHRGIGEERFRSFCAAAAHAPITTVATASTSSGVRICAICGRRAESQCATSRRRPSSTSRPSTASSRAKAPQNKQRAARYETAQAAP